MKQERRCGLSSEVPSAHVRRCVVQSQRQPQTRRRRGKEQTPESKLLGPKILHQPMSVILCYPRATARTSRLLTTTQVNTTFTDLRRVSIFQDLKVRNQSASLRTRKVQHLIKPELEHSLPYLESLLIPLLVERKVEQDVVPDTGVLQPSCLRDVCANTGYDPFVSRNVLEGREPCEDVRWRSRANDLSRKNVRFAKER